MRKLVLATILLAGCGHANDSRWPAPPANGLQMRMPEFTVPANSETLTCVHETFPGDQDAWVRRFDTFQAAGGHHLAVFLDASAPKPDGTVEDCTDPASMVNMRPLLTGLPSTTEGNGFELPDGTGMAVRVPAHAALVFQSHYVNATSAPVVSHDAANLTFLDPGVTPMPVGTWSTTTLDFEVPANGDLEVTYHCPVPRPMSVFAAFGHMHQWGRALHIGVGSVTLQDIDPWQPIFRDHPPVVSWPFDAPLVLGTSDTLDVTCRWHDDDGQPKSFPHEMCVGVLWFYPAPDPLICAATPQ
jgi:hypothetical protein